LWLLARHVSAKPLRSLMSSARELTRVSADEARAQVDAELRRIEQTGAPIAWRAVIPPDVPDAENAALLYQQAFDKIILSPEDEELLSNFLSAIREPPRGKVPPPGALQALVARKAEAIALLEAAAQRPRCRFPVDYSDPVTALFPHLSQMRKCARLLSVRMFVQAQRGEMSAALDTMGTSLGLCRALAAEPLLIGALVRYAVLGLGLDGLRASLRDRAAPTEACRRLARELSDLDVNSSFRRGLWTERTMGIWLFNAMRQDPKRAGGYFTDGTETEGTDMERFYRSGLGQKVLYLDEAAYLRLMSQLIAASALPWREQSEAGASLEAQVEQLPMHCVMTRILVFSGAGRKRDERVAQLGLAQAALGLKAYRSAHGAYPDTLDALRQGLSWPLRQDPFTGADLVYRREGEGFLLYSIGWDLKDDKGLPVGRPLEGRPGGYDCEHGDIVWRCTR